MLMLTAASYVSLSLHAKAALTVGLSEMQKTSGEMYTHLVRTEQNLAAAE